MGVEGRPLALTRYMCLSPAPMISRSKKQETSHTPKTCHSHLPILVMQLPRQHLTKSFCLLKNCNQYCSWNTNMNAAISSALNLQELDLHQNTQLVDLHPHSEILESSYTYCWLAIQILICTRMVRHEWPNLRSTDGKPSGWILTSPFTIANNYCFNERSHCQFLSALKVHCSWTWHISEWRYYLLNVHLGDQS